MATNPPFSLFREYMAQLVKFEKKFIVIGNINAITYKDIFKLIKDNNVWLGQSIHSGDHQPHVPDSYPLMPQDSGGWKWRISRYVNTRN